MRIETGVDAVEIGRVQGSIQRPGFLERYFSEDRRMVQSMISAWNCIRKLLAEAPPSTRRQRGQRVLRHPCQGQRRRLRGAGLHRPGGAPLGYVRPGGHPGAELWTIFSPVFISRKQPVP